VRKAATIRDVALEAGVSVAVVSRVLNPGTGPVAPQTRARVVEAIERLGYRPRAAARELQQRSATTIGLVLADLANPFFARLADRVVWECRARGIHAVLLTTQEDPRLEAESIETLIGRSVGSVIATPTGGNHDKWAELVALGVDVVFVDREIDDLLEVDLVTIRNDVSAQVATDHLLGLGHERIAFISGPLSTSTGRDRVAGFRHAMDRAGVGVDERLIHAIPFRGDAGSDAVSSLLALPNPPTGLIVGNTAQVRSALRRVKQSPVVVPDDLSLIVFDDNPWTELVSPPLSVVRQPIDMLALHAVDLAVGRLKGQYSEAPQRILVDAEFVQRSSSAPHPSPVEARSSRLR
jgi:LacI family transcriptional regulator